LALSFTRKDIRDIHALGLISWTHGDDRAYFLTKDSRIREMPVVGGYSDVYGVPRRDLSGAKILFQSGLLFIAPAEGKLVVLRPAERPTYIELDIPAGAGLSRRGDKLFIGERRIRIDGPNPSQVRLE
jgi:hypothetical protein